MTQQVTLAARSGRPDTRIRGLLRQIPDALPTTRIESVSFGPRPDVRPALLSEVLENNKVLIHPDGRDTKEFHISYTMRMGQKRASGTGTLINSVVETVKLFYADVAQNITAPK